MKLEFIGAGFIAHFRAVAVRQVRPLDIQRRVMASYLSAERAKTIDLTDKAMLAELDSYVPAIQQGKGAAQLQRAE